VLEGASEMWMANCDPLLAGQSLIVPAQRQHGFRITARRPAFINPCSGWRRRFVRSHVEAGLKPCGGGRRVLTREAVVQRRQRAHHRDHVGKRESRLCSRAGPRQSIVMPGLSGIPHIFVQKFFFEEDGSPGQPG